MLFKHLADEPRYLYDSKTFNNIAVQAIPYIYDTSEQITNTVDREPDT